MLYASSATSRSTLKTPEKELGKAGEIRVRDTIRGGIEGREMDADEINENNIIGGENGRYSIGGQGAFPQTVKQITSSSQLCVVDTRVALSIIAEVQSGTAPADNGHSKSQSQIAGTQSGTPSCQQSFVV